MLDFRWHCIIFHVLIDLPSYIGRTSCPPYWLLGRNHHRLYVAVCWPAVLCRCQKSMKMSTCDIRSGCSYHFAEFRWFIGFVDFRHGFLVLVDLLAIDIEKKNWFFIWPWLTISDRLECLISISSVCVSVVVAKLICSGFVLELI